jgi:hypothetical protein
VVGEAPQAAQTPAGGPYRWVDRPVYTVKYAEIYAVRSIFLISIPCYCCGMDKFLKATSLKTFLCHSHTDRDAVHDLYLRLKKDHIQPWLDRENLLPGQNWAYEISNAILRSDMVIVCLSRGFDDQNGFRHQELKIALRKARALPVEDIFIIPVRLEKCELPDSLHHLHRVDLFETGGYKKLMESLRRYVETVRNS